MDPSPLFLSPPSLVPSPPTSLRQDLMICCPPPPNPRSLEHWEYQSEPTMPDFAFSYCTAGASLAHALGPLQGIERQDPQPLRP